MIINRSEMYRPFNRKRGIINNIEVTISDRGSIQAIHIATGRKIGDSAICCVKIDISISLLIPVYKKSMTTSREIISTIVNLDIYFNLNVFSISLPF